MARNGSKTLSYDSSTFVEDEQTVESTFEDGSGDVPIPDDLFQEESSPRYPLPDDLVKVQYPTVLVPTLPQPGALRDRIVFVAPMSENVSHFDLGAYESAAQQMGQSFPLRVAELRNLWATLQEAQSRLTRLFEIQEQERANINRRNNVNNRQIDHQLATLEQDWKRQRQACRDEIRATEDAKMEYKLKRQPEVEEARQLYWAVREAAARERDERERCLREQQATEAAQARTEAKDRRQAERQRQEEERLQARKKAEITEQQCAEERERQWKTLHERATAAEEAAHNAETIVLQVEHEAWERQQQREHIAWERQQQREHIAWEAYQTTQSETLARLEEEGQQLYLAAQTVENELLAEQRQREQWLHTMYVQGIGEKQQRIEQVGAAQRDAVQAAARAGLLPGQENDIASALSGKLSEAIVAEATDTAHLTPAHETKYTVFCRQIIKILTHVAFGGIFGISLGLLMGLIDLTPEGLQKTAHFFVVAGFLGTLVFYLIGQFVYLATAFATEQCASDQRRNWFGAIPAIVLATVVLPGVTAMEAYVERYGIVESVVQQQQQQGEEGKISADREFAYWMVAFLLVAPFVGFHAYEGVTETRCKLGQKRRQERLAVEQYALLSRPEVHAVSEAQGILSSAKQHLENFDNDFARLKAEAERRLVEIAELLQTHPTLIRWRQFAENRDTLLANDPKLREALTVLETARHSLNTDPALLAARERAEQARQLALEARQKADAADQSLIQQLQTIAEQLRVASAQNVAVAETDASVPGEQPATPEFHNTLPAPPSPRVEILTREASMAKERWEHLRNAITNDAQVRFYQNRIEQLQAEIRSLDAQFGKRRKQLLEQKRAIVLHYAQAEESNRITAEMRERWNAAEADVQAARLTFDEALEQFRRLVETPAFLRWFEVLRQNYFRQSTTQRQLEAAKRPALTSVSGIAGQ